MGAPIGHARVARCLVYRPFVGAEVAPTRP